MRNFLIVPQPKIDESISSFIIRLTTENKYEKTKWVFECLNLVNSLHVINHIYNCDSDHPSLQKLSDMTNLDIETIIGMTFLPALGDYNNTDSFIDSTLRVKIHRLNVKICPHCLNQDLYYKKVWDLHQYNMCHIHKCLLINKCDTCHRKIFIKTKSNLSKCICGRDYRNMMPVYLDENGIERFIYEKMHGIHTSNNNFLYSLDFKDALFIITNLTSKFLHKTVNANFSVEQRNSIMNDIFNSFENFPDSFYTFLDNYHRKLGNQNEGLLRGFGRIYKDMVGKYGKDKNLYFMYEAFANYINYHWNGNIMKVRGQNREFLNKQWLTRQEAADFLNKRIGTINKLIESGKLETKSVKKSREHTLVNLKSLSDYKANEAKIDLEIDKLKRYTLTLRQSIALEEIGVIKKGKVRNGYHKFEASSIISFFQFLNLTAKPFQPQKNIEYIGFNSVVRKYCQFRTGLRGVFQDIINGELSVYRANEEVTSLSSLVFVESEVNQLAIRRQYNTKGDIAKKLGISTEKVAYLLDNLYLESKNIGSYLVVEESDIQKFKSKFIFSNEIKDMIKKFDDGISNQIVQNYIYLMKIDPLNKKKKSNDPLIYDRQECIDKLNKFLNHLTSVKVIM
ncbi:TniQ family protein [Robertmurraya massiliosenegalensis]|uniref:TniQ family protein n=1 Tax=Robertmurraya massiliosenegalensis TaxID=1287657 RepID=UPI0003111251|nr:TniQ family protein [Robertmurraya massiliosenegalensis]